MLHHVCEIKEKNFHYVQNSGCLDTIVYDNKPVCNNVTEQCFVMVISMDTHTHIYVYCIMIHAIYKVSAFEELEWVQIYWLISAW